MTDKDPYKTLGVSEDASDGEIKRAYRKLARKYHPDVNDSAEAERRFKAVNDAYDVLKDPEKRAAFHAAGQTHQGPFQRSNWRGGFSFSDFTGRPDDPFADIFEAFGQRGRSDRGGAFSADQHVRLQVTLEEAVRGASRSIILKQPVIDAQGNVVLEDRSVAIPVPKGVMPGQFLRLPGQGLMAQEGGRHGDLFVEVTFAPHPTYRVDGKDLLLELPIAPWEAALGTSLDLATPGGDVKLKVPQNARSGQKLRLKGKGLPTTPPGHLYATLRIVNPDASSAEAQKVFETMAKSFDFNPRSSLKR